MMCNLVVLNLFSVNDFSGGLGLGLSTDSGFISNHHYNMNSPTAAAAAAGCAKASSSIASGGSMWPPAQEKSNGVVGAIGGGGRGVSMNRGEVWDDDAEDLAELFGRLGLGKYTNVFQQQEVRML
jgi:hypothetical protein